MTERGLASFAVSWAEQAARLAHGALADTLPRRWAHVQSVAERAQVVAAPLGDDAEADVLVSAAWLHDVGYAPRIVDSGFHPLDGARHIRSLGYPERVAGLVAFHSTALVKAQILGLDEQLQAEFDDERTVLRDLLWYADMTTGPGGAAVTFDERMSEIRHRRADQPDAIAALDRSLAERRATVGRAQRWLDERHVRAEPPPGAAGPAATPTWRGGQPPFADPDPSRARQRTSTRR
nr:HD domain-containing protein [Pseudonocardia alni]